MTGTPLLIGAEERSALADLCKLAELRPVDMMQLQEVLKNPQGKRGYMKRMTEQSVYLPAAYCVTLSIEINHPGGGKARHMSMSVDRLGHVPSPEAVWMVAEEIGFTGDLSKCAVWAEKLQGHGQAINVVQLIAEDE